MSSTTETQQHEAIETESTTETATEQPPQVLTADQVAKLLHVNRKTVYKAFKQGDIPGGRRVGGTIRFSRARVLQWLDQGQECAPRSPRGAR